jgi:hypothetical protein
MSEHKFNIESGRPESGQAAIKEPLFDEEPLDLDTHGGLVVLETGQVAEVVPLNFIPKGGDTGLSGKRVQPLPFDVVEGPQGREIRWRPTPYDAAAPTIGLEAEHLAMCDHDGRWFEISPDGKELHYPHGLLVETAEDRGHQPEFLKTITESGSSVGNLAHGYDDFADRSRAEKADKRRWGVKNGIVFVPVSGYPEVVKDEDITEHPYIQMLKNHKLMPHFLEYSACLSEQLNIQWRSPEAGAFAINSYQILQSVLNIVTAASPARDGSLHTTLREHYERDDSGLTDLVARELGPAMDRVPYDWRELARAYGSPSGGIIQEAAPLDLESLLRNADRQLRRSEIMTVGRSLGWHTDRWRPDRDVMEISNLSHAGDHPRKMPAAEETVIKTVQALQEYFYDSGAGEKYDPAWIDIIPAPAQRHDRAFQQRLVDASRVNNMLTAVFGKERAVFDAFWEERTPREIFEAFVGFTAVYAPEPISEPAAEEIRATLEQPPELDEFDTLNDVLAYFYSDRSRMTAVEALRLAKEKDNLDPEITMNDVLQRMAHYALRIHRERAAAEARRNT